MSALGKGLASLIGGSEDPDDVLDRIDQMEIIDEEEETPAPAPKQAPKQKTTVSVVEDFGDLEEDEEIMEMPSRPNVTPLTLDPDGSLKVKEEAEKAQAASDAYKPGFGEEGTSEIWDQHEEKVEHIAMGDIRINPLQPRRAFDPAELAELKDSIQRHGILQPLVVRRLGGNDGYELIAGERRLRAAKELEWLRVPCVVRRDVKSDQSRLVFALIENIQREDLSPVEEALAYQQLNHEYGLSHEEIGQRIGKSRVAVTNMMRVLQLPAEVQRGIIEGQITMGHAKAILMIPDEDKQIRFYKHLVDEGITVRKAEMRARRIQRQMNLNDPQRRKVRTRHPLAQKFGPALEGHYGHDVYVRFKESSNRFDVTFKAYSEDDLKLLIGKLMGTAPLPDQDRDREILGEDEDED